jgi:hypothetical protein
MAAILSKPAGCQIFKWVDNFLIIHPPIQLDNTLVAATESSIYALAQPLRQPGKPFKPIPFALTFMYLGFEWSIPSCSIEIPLKRCTKY